MVLLSFVKLLYNSNWICFIIDEFYNINSVIFMFINVEILWKNLYSKKCYINKCDLSRLYTVYLQICPMQIKNIYSCFNLCLTSLHLPL